MFKKIYAKWLKIGKKIALFQVRFMVTVTYFCVIIPYGIFYRIVSRPFKSGWIEKEIGTDSLKDARRQF